MFKMSYKIFGFVRVPPDTLRKISEVFPKGVKTFLDFFSVKGE
jgi:hypothetical protein